MPTTLEQLTYWINAPRETEHLEFKEAKTQYDNTKLFRHCVALANEGGGKLILGITDAVPRTVIGTSAFRPAHGIQSRIFDKLGFRVEVEEFSHANGRVLIFHIPGRPHGTAYELDGAYWMRSTSGTVPMSEDQLRHIFDEGKPDWFSRPAAENCSDAEVIQLIDTQSYFDLVELPYPENRAGVLERLQQEDLIAPVGSQFVITNLGAILFAKRLDQFPDLKRKAPRFIVYEGTDKLKVRLDRVGNKGYAVGFSGLIDFISNQIPSNEFMGKAYRVEMKMFPNVAVRELVANALIHQDFTDTRSFITVELYTDRLEISNPGKPAISTERFIDGLQSRNEKLADLMRRIGVCEERGSGVDRVVTLAEFWQLPAPDFYADEQRTAAILFAHRAFNELDGKDRVRACYQHCVLSWSRKQKMTNQTLRERFKLPINKSETVSRIMRRH
ncbi:MAG TPA: ATP-binding protein [Pyrinomonadaceae bacterium]|nr:ATP-binding protein [Pyrinomonadaceae bacterium]